MSIHGSSLQRTRGVLAAVVVAIALCAAPATASADETTGWLRLGHLSPDTKKVDVTVTGADGAAILELRGVGYGDVSPYSELAPGSYRVSMRPMGAAASTSPVIASSIRIGADEATTVVAYGPSEDLEVKAIADDLTEPTPGTARIRLMQASTVTDTVDVATSTGLPIATDARAGSVTAYAEVPAGPWTLDLAGGDIRGSSDVTVAAGSVVTLFVLDTASGGLTILPIVDSAAVGASPDGGVATGGGGMATAPKSRPGGLLRAV